MRTASRPPLRRLLALDRMIRSDEFPIARMAAADLEVHRRTILRDLDFLRDSWGAPVEFCPRRNGYNYRDADYALPLMRITEGELLALFLAERLMQQYRGTPYEQDLATAFSKLTSQLPDEVNVDLSHLDQAFSFTPAGIANGDVRRFRQVGRAVREGRRLELGYWTASRDEECRRVVDPYHLTSVAGDWYLVAYCHLREEVRMFAPGRIRSVGETGERFERPADFRIEESLDGTFRAMRGDGRPRRVRLRFTAEAARTAADELNRLRQHLRRIVVASHQEEFAKRFPVVWQLSQIENGTTAVAVRQGAAAFSGRSEKRRYHACKLAARGLLSTHFNGFRQSGNMQIGVLGEQSTMRIEVAFPVEGESIPADRLRVHVLRGHRP